MSDPITNRPALPAISYRAGRYATFNASMLAALSDPAFPALAPLRTRDSGDFSLALLDGWAVLLDILTFYQERFANEAYLRTAIDQRSVAELARLTGYVPSPGVSASALLAFTLSDAPGSPDTVPIPAGSRVQSVPGPGQTAQVFETAADLAARVEWNSLPAQATTPWRLAGGDTGTWIAGTANGVSTGDMLLFLQASNGQPVTARGFADFHHVTDVRPDHASGNTRIEWDSKLASSFRAGWDATQVLLYVFRKKAALYGVQAPSPQVLSGTYIGKVPGYPTDITNSPTWDFYEAGYGVGSYQINLDASYPGLNSLDSWLVLTSPDIGTSHFQISGVAETSPDLYTLTAKTTQLTLHQDGNRTDEVLHDFVGDTPNVTAYVRSDRLTLAGLPVTDPVSGSTLSVIGGQTIAPGQPIAISGKSGGEAAVVQRVTVNGEITTLTLAAPLTGSYDPGSVTVNANAAWGTDGQTTHEILGSGDATNPALSFTLKQAPLTYLPAPSGNGAQSTLQVWVNNLRWQETSSLLTAGPADRVFVTSADPSGHTVIQFGNGVQGARPPTGTANIRAAYRIGIGTGGMVAAGQLSQPLDRPQGVSSVTNPSPASGGADPATADAIRASAPLPTLTIGRVVSLEDYQNYALGFAGISMALATWTWFGGTRGVFLTVAGADGAVLAADDPVITSLASAIRLSGDPHVPLRIASYQPVSFTFGAAVVIDQANYAPAQVLAAVWQDLGAAFAFGRRRLGQPVAASEITQIIQRTAGVTAVQLQGFPPLLCASGPQPPDGAQLLRLDPATQGRIGVWSP